MKSTLLSIALLLASVVTFAAPSAQTIGGVVYEFDASTESFVIAGYDALSSATALTFASRLTVDGVDYEVSSMKASAFASNTSLVSVVFLAKLTTLPASAFDGCTALSSVTLPPTLESVGANAFRGCSSLTAIRLPGKVSRLDEAAFKGCSALTSVTFDGRPTLFGGAGETAVFAGVGSALAPAVLNIPAALYASKIYKSGLNWGGYFAIAPIIPTLTQTLGGVVYRYKESITNPAFGVDLDQPCYVVDGYDASAADATADVFVPSVVSGLPVLAIYSLSNAAIRTVEIDTLFSYKVSGTDYPLLMNIEAIKDIAEVPDHLAFAGLGSEGHEVDVYVPTLDEALNLWTSIVYQVGTPKGGYLNVYGRRHTQGGVVYSYNRRGQYYSVVGFDAATANKTVVADSYTYAVDVIGELRGIFPVRELADNAFNAVSATPNYNAETAYIKRLTLPSTLRSIGSFAVRGLAMVDSLVIPASVETISAGAFVDLGSSKQGSQVITLIGSPEFKGANAFLAIGRNDKHAKLLCPEEDVDRYTKLAAPGLYGGYFDIVANTRKLSLLTDDDKVLTLTGAGDYSYLSKVNITAAVNDAGYEFTGWSDGVSAAERTITLDKDTTLKASFSIRSFDVNVIANNALMGTVSGGGNYIYKTPISLEATANEGYHFVNWNGNADLTSPKLDLIVTLGGAEYVAYFAPDKYDITLSSNYPACTVTGAGSYDYKQNVTISTSAADGYEFVSWSDGVTLTTREVEVPVGGLTLEANYRKLGQYTIAVVCDPAMGVVTGSTSDFENAVVHITAKANEGYQFIGWADDDEILNTERDIVVGKQNVTYTALFEPLDYEIFGAVNNAIMGSVTGLGFFPYNGTTTIHAVAKGGYHFVEWEDGSTDADRVVTIPLGGTTYTATFAIDRYTIIAEANDPLAGVVTGGGEYDFGSVVTITATANPGYVFKGWADDDKKTSRNITLVVDGKRYEALFEPLDYEITTAVNSTKMGTVEGAGIYPYRKEVTLTATPKNGYHFAYWDDNSTNPERVVSIPLGGGKYTATFEPNTYEVVVDYDRQMGVVEGEGMQTYGNVVTLKAVPNEGYEFVAWADNAHLGAERKFSLAIGGNHFAVTFAPLKYNITTSANNSDWGTTTGDGTFAYRTKTTIEATPKTGYKFVMWEDGSISARRTISVPLGGAGYSAIFAPEQYAIDVTSSDLTMGSCNGSGTYDYGSMVDIEAIANEGYVFTAWSDGNLNAKRTVTIEAAAGYVAYFAPQNYDIAVTVNDPAMGSVSGTGTFPYLSEQTLVATPAEGYRFVEWDDKSTQTERKVIVPVGGATYTATFAPLQYQITVDVEDADMGTVSGTGTYDYKQLVPIEAVASTGYHFVRWSDGNTDAKRDIEVPIGGATYTATFAPNSYAVSLEVNDPAMGSVTGAGDYNYQTTAHLVATPAYGYHFVSWSDEQTEAERDIIVTDNISLTAIFAANKYTVTALTIGEGSVSGAGEYDYGATATLLAQPADGYRFIGWTDGVQDAQRSLVVSQDTTLTAQFEQITYTITLLVNNEQWGTVEGAGTYPVGTVLTIKAVAADGYRFETWSDGVTEAERDITVDADLTLTAEFVTANTGLDNISATDSQRARKVIINGQVFILTPDGKRYSVTGAELK